MNWDRVNVWTNTLYTLLHSIEIAKAIQFGNLDRVHENVVAADGWTSTACTYDSVLLKQPFGGMRIKLRRDPNSHFDQISSQVIKMLIQELTVIFDEMMAESLAAHGYQKIRYPQSKINKLATHLNPKYLWSQHGGLELIAVRNTLTHNEGIWSAESIRIISPFIPMPPRSGDKLEIGVSMLFRYRKAMRTFLNETSI
jgi:hypothetical protein